MSCSRSSSPEAFLEQEKLEKLEKKVGKLNLKSKIKDKNKGTGAGGANTNKNGLPFEKSTDLESTCSVEREEKYTEFVKFDDDKNNKIYCHIKEKKLLKYLVPKVPGAHGCKQPDDCYIEEKRENSFHHRKEDAKSKWFCW